MEITEVRIKLVENASERLRAFCSITLDGDFVIRDLKIIDGTSGAFVAMPSRKLMDRCSRCGSKNHLRSRFCNECGCRLNENRAPKDAHGRAKLHADVAHPINAACRERVQNAVVEAYQEELERAKSPDYKPTRYDDYDDFDDDATEGGAQSKRSTPPSPTKTREQTREEPSRTASSKSDDQFGDYNELIADLKRDAQNRQQERREQDLRRSSYPGHASRSNFDDAPDEDTDSERSEPPQDEVSRQDEDMRPDPPETADAPSRAGSSQDDDDDDVFGAGL